MTFISWILESIVSFFTKKLLGGVFSTKSPAQEAVNTETQIAQIAADSPDKDKAIQELENGAA
jgi:hypothetical protein